MKLIKSLSDTVQQLNSVTEKMEEVPLTIKIELENRLDADTAIDLQFSKGFIEYNRIFERNFGFSSIEEMNLVIDIIKKMIEYDKQNKPTFISVGLNNMLSIKSGINENVYDLKTPQLLKYVTDIIQWIYHQGV